ncbi:YitT family protein [Azospirillum doebereinerae]|nr:YitT family protein [Azospirillum doebereinerae]
MTDDFAHTITPSPASVTYERPKASHNVFDNLQGQVFGIVMTSFGIAILHAAGLITGQAAGLSFVISYATGINFGVLFFLVNLPFYFLALARIGVRFTVNSVAAVTGISLLSSFLPTVMGFSSINPYVAAVLAGFCVGIGVIGLFRHGASGGGVGILAYYVQEKTGFRAGWLQALFDVVIFSAAAFVVDFESLLASALGAVVLNAFVSFNHRADWYVAR